MKEIDVATLHEQLNQVANLIDVREVDEYAEAHVAPAVNHPLSRIDSWLSTLNPNESYTVICRSGRRSAQAIDQMKTHGITGINVIGGTLAWQAAGYPTVKE